MTSTVAAAISARVSPASRRLLRSATLGGLAAYPGLMALLQVSRAVSLRGWSDWLAFATGGRLVVATPAALYSMPAQAAMQAQILGHPTVSGYFAYANAPLLALFASPVAALPAAASAPLWTAFLLICFAAAVLVGARLLPARWPRPQRIAVALALLSTGAVVQSLGYGQLVAIAMLGLLLALDRVRRHGDSAIAGLLLGVVAVKPQYVWLVPVVLICARLWRTLAGFGLAAAVWLASTLAVVGVHGSVAWVTDFIPQQFTGQISQGNALPGMLAQSGLPGFAGFRGAVLCAGVAVAVMWWRRGSLRASPLLAVAIGVMVSVLCSPHAFDYDLAWGGVLLVLLVSMQRVSLPIALGFAALADVASLQVGHAGSQWPQVLALEGVVIVAVALARPAARWAARRDAVEGIGT